MGMRCLLPSSAGLAGSGLSLQSRCGAPLARGNLPGLAGHVAEPAIRCVATRVLLLAGMTMLYRTGAGDLGVAACAASP